MVSAMEAVIKSQQERCTMSRTGKALVFIFSIFMAFTISGCGPSTSITSSWVSEQPPAKTVDNIVIIAIAKEQVSRKLWENVFVQQLAGKNIRAVASHTIVEGPIPPEEQAVLDVVRRAKADTVLITHLVDSKTDIRWHPGAAHYEPSAFYHGMYGYYGRAYGSVYSSPVTTTRTVVRLESNLYDAGTAKLVWAAQSETVNPKLLKTDFESVVRSLLADLSGKKLL